MPAFVDVWAKVLEARSSRPAPGSWEDDKEDLGWGRPRLQKRGALAGLNPPTLTKRLRVFGTPSVIDALVWWPVFRVLIPWSVVAVVTGAFLPGTITWWPHVAGSPLAGEQATKHDLVVDRDRESNNRVVVIII